MERPPRKQSRKNKKSWCACKRSPRRRTRRGSNSYLPKHNSRGNRNSRNSWLLTLLQEKCLQNNTKIWWLRMRRGMFLMVEDRISKLLLINKQNKIMQLMFLRDQETQLNYWTNSPHSPKKKDKNKKPSTSSSKLFRKDWPIVLLLLMLERQRSKTTTQPWRFSLPFWRNNNEIQIWNIAPI